MKTNKILSVVLTLCVLLAMCSLAAFAADETAVAAVGDMQYATLAEAITAAKDGDTVTLLTDTTEDAVLAKSITLDLGAKTLTGTAASGKATLTVAAGATAVVKNGTVLGTANSYYAIQNNGTLTLEDVTATAGNTGSSMLDNWGTLTITSGTYTGGLNVVKSEEGSTLTINGGTFTLSYSKKWEYNAVILVYGNTTINGGMFIQNAKTTSSYPQVVMTGVVDGYTSSTTITGGTFKNNFSDAKAKIFWALGKATDANFAVSGGSFNKAVSDSYCAEGFIPTKNADGTYGVKEGSYVAAIGSTKYETLAAAITAAKAGKTVTLLADTALTSYIVVDKAITIDLDGKTVTANLTSYYAFAVTADVTFQNGTISITSSNGGISVADKLTLVDVDITGAAVNAPLLYLIGDTETTIDKDSTVTATASSGVPYPAILMEGSYADETIKLNIYGSVSGKVMPAVQGNGADKATSYINIYDGASVTSDKLAMYLPQICEVNISGGLVDGYCGIGIKSGTLNITGGTVRGHQKDSDISDDYSTTNSINYDGSAILVDSYIGYAGQVKISISGDAVVESLYSTAIREIGKDASQTNMVALEVTGGTVKGASGKDAVLVRETTKNVVAISGGSFSSEVPADYCADGYVPTANADGTYGVAAVKAFEVWTGYNVTKVAAYATLEEAVANLGENKWIVVGADATLTTDFTIPTGVFVDVASGATLTVAESATLTVAKDCKRFGVRTGATVVNNGTILVCGTDYNNGKVMIQTGATLDPEKLTVPEGYILSKNNTNYYASLAYFTITYADGTTKTVDTLSSTNLENATKATMLRDKSDFALSFPSGLTAGFVLDLGGHTLSSTTTSTSTMLSIYSDMTLTNGTIKYLGSDNGGALYTQGNVTIADSLTVDGGNGYAVYMGGEGKTLTVNGTLTADGDYAITGNGSETAGSVDDCSVVVNDGAAISAANGIAIYHSMRGTVTVNGGAISGHTGIQMCAGKLVVNGGEISSTGANQDYTGSTNAMPDGAAISIVNRNYPGGTPTMEITGGTVKATGEGALAVKAYDYTADTVAAWTDAGDYINVSGGTFSTEVDKDYCADGYSPITNADGSYTVAKPTFGKIIVITCKPTEEEGDITYNPISVYTAIDSLNYKRVGFKYSVEATSKEDGSTLTPGGETETRVVYTAITGTDNDGNAFRYSAENMGADYIYGHHFRFNAAVYAGATTKLIITPYAETLDGVIIEGKTIEISESTVGEGNMFRESK